jgi:general secretion pathway protein E
MNEKSAPANAMSEPDRNLNASIAERFFSSIPIELCRHERFCLRTGVVETLGVESPLLLCHTETAKPAVLDSIRRFLGSPIGKAIIGEQELELMIDQSYETFRTQKSFGQVSHAVSDEASQAVLKPIDSDADLLRVQSSAPIVDLVNRILFQAVQQRSSDIHFQPREDCLMVRIRLDGILVEFEKIAKDVQEEVLARIKIAGRMDIAEKRLPQDGRATVYVGSRAIDLRIASMPSNHGERIVIRLLDKSARLYDLTELGMDAVTLSKFRSAIAVEHGLILVTGPTGSGKSTTLYAALKELDTTQRNAVTLEDPIEYQLEGISQTQINLKKGMTFASGLRSVLRQDPDIIMVGEIRDSETAAMAVQAALTGHLVFSTLHTNDAASAITRTLDLGIEPYLVASCLVSVLAQRLVRKLCVHCKHQIDPMMPSLGWRANGCERCKGLGYSGRIGIYELMIVNEDLRGLVTRSGHATLIRDSAVADGMRLLKDSGLEKVVAGVTSLEEVQRVTLRASM